MDSKGVQALQQVRSEWESAVDSVPQLISVLRKDGVIMRANMTLEHWGLGKVKTVQGESIHQILHPGCTDKNCYLKKLMALTSKVLATGEGVEYRVEDHILNRDFHIRLNPLDTGKGRELGYLVITFSDVSGIDLTHGMRQEGSRWSLTDVAPTDRESDLTESKNRLVDLTAPIDFEDEFRFIEKVKREWESAVDSLHHIICLVDESGSIVRANRAIEQWKLGDVTSVRGRKLHDLLHPGCDDASCYLHSFSRLIAQVSKTGQVAECQEQDSFLGRHLHFQINAYAPKAAKQDGLVVVLVTDVTDIKRAKLRIEHINSRLEKQIESRNLILLKKNQKLRKEIEQRKLVEEELKRSREEYSLLVETMNEGMVIQDASRKIVYMNKRMLKMLGLSRKQVIGREFSDFVESDYIDHWEGEKLESIKGLESAYVIRIKAKGGRSLWVKVSPQPLWDSEKKFKGSFAVITDINEHIEIERKLMHTEHQLRAISKQVLTVQELERKRIASELHDGIGQTLSAIKFYVENSIVNLPEKASPMTEKIEKVVPKLQDAIDELRRISMDLRPSLLDDIGILATLSWFCRESRLMYPYIDFVMVKTNVEEKDIPAPLKTEIFRIVQEAVNNATKYSKAKSIQISLKHPSKMIVLELKDDGIGFDAKRVASQQGYSESKGLGLVSMRERVENSGGWFTLTSGENSGTAIVCSWPLDSYPDGVFMERRQQYDRRGGGMVPPLVP